jgi:NitT/TauT family transport system ATP-binding protein
MTPVSPEPDSVVGRREDPQPGFPRGLRYNSPRFPVHRKTTRMEFLCTNIAKTYASTNGRVTALQNLDLRVGSHEFLCIVGPSGCGKTTLLKLIAGIQTPSMGSIEFESPSPKQAPRCAMVFQDHGLFPWMTVLDNAAFGLEAQGIPAAERRQKADYWLKKLGLDRFSGNYPHELSGGMRQRAALGRAFLVDSPILLMDEPFSALDAQTRLLLQTELLHCWAEKRQTVVYVTHDIDEAIMLGDRILVMSRRPGRILDEYRVPLSRPRVLQAAAHPDAVALKWKIWQRIQSKAEPAT